MDNNYTTHLKNKSLISVTGDNSKDFLNNIITNDVNKLDKDKSIYSCLLSPQGKVISHFFIFIFGQGYQIMIDDFLKEELIQKLNFYKLRLKLTIELNQKYKIIYSKNKIEKSEYNFTDPRNENFGYYHILHSQDDNFSTTLNQTEEYNNLINTNGLVDNIFQNIKGNYFSLELNMKELNAIDFSKGCYVGQENTARMNLKEKISKRVFLLKSEDNLEIEEDVIFNNEIIGKVISTNPNFAMIKMAKFNDFINQKIETKSSKNINIIKPNWI